jgi:hypothetical protein
MNTGFLPNPAFSFGAPKVTSCCIPQLCFSFYRHRPVRADFSGGQISSDAGLLPLRAFDQRHGLTRDLANCLSDLREDERIRHSVLSLFRQRLYQIIAGYEDANDADRLRHASCCIPQLCFSFYRHRPVRADFSGGQISSDAGLLPLRAFDQRHGLTRDLATLSF